MNEKHRLAFDLGWPPARLGEALGALSERSGFAPRGSVAAPAAQLDGAVDSWLAAAAAHLGLEAEAVDSTCAEIDGLIASSAPALLRVASPSDVKDVRFLALVSSRRGRLRVVAPDHATHPVDAGEVRELLSRAIEKEPAAGVDALLARAGIEGPRRERVRRVLLDEMVGAQRIGGCWLVRPAATAKVSDQLREAHLPGLFLTLVTSHALHYSLWIASWALLGKSVLEGRLDQGWLIAWGLMLLTLVPMKLIAFHAGGLLAVRGGAFLKRRLLQGALRMDREEVRHEGVGQLLGRVMESEVLEQMAVNGGFLGFTAIVELVMASVVLGLGAGGWIHVLLFLLWLGVTFRVGWSYLVLRREWTGWRLSLTNDLLERMVGHRTRLAQERRERWNDGEDEALERYHELSRKLDRWAARLEAFVPRGWFVVGVLGLTPAFVAGGHSMASLAVAVGGVLLAFQAFKDLAEGFEKILDGAVAWERVRPFWKAASRGEAPGQIEYAAMGTGAEPETETRAEADTDSAPRSRGALLEARDLVFRHRHRAEPVFSGLDFRLDAGDRVLLEGPSGGGKSTLGMLLAGSRDAASGFLLLGGLDRATLGSAAWRRRVVIVPQFHDNHVLMGTFAFNALMGRGWPPRPEDLEDAERVVRALGLGPLVERMPAGLAQPIGETGWQLSHGERSRLFIARALLQNAEVLIFDESFAALDPETLRATLGHVLEKAPTLVTIAHP